MRTWRYLFVLLFFSSCMLFQPKRIGYNAAEKISTTLEGLSTEDKIAELSERAIEGAITGSITEVSEENLDKLAKSLSKKIEVELSKTFQKLDTKTPGKKFSSGVVERLLSEETEQALSKMLSEVISSADNDLSKAIHSLSHNINKDLSEIFAGLDKNISSMDKSFENMLSKKLQDSLSHFVNEAIADIDLKPLAQKISTDLLSKQLKDSIVYLAADIKKEMDIIEPIPDILRVIRTNLIWFLIFISLLIAGLIYYRHYLKTQAILGDELVEIIGGLSEEDKREIEKKISDKRSLEIFKRRTRNKS